jgi:hypothetical protein
MNNEETILDEVELPSRGDGWDGMGDDGYPI